MARALTGQDADGGLRLWWDLLLRPFLQPGRVNFCMAVWEPYFAGWVPEWVGGWAGGRAGGVGGRVGGMETLFHGLGL